MTRCHQYTGAAGQWCGDSRDGERRRDTPKATIRDQLQAHATHATCASCHARIDPLGFAFENYDAVGAWRTQERVRSGTGDDPVVDASGMLPNGKTFQTPDEFKRLLVEDTDRFAEAFIEQLATYALRRVITVDDSRQAACGEQRDTDPLANRRIAGWFSPWSNRPTPLSRLAEYQTATGRTTAVA